MKEALDVDSSIHTHPVSVKVRNPAEINEIVDTITYHKVNSSQHYWQMSQFLRLNFITIHILLSHFCYDFIDLNVIYLSFFSYFIVIFVKRFMHNMMPLAQITRETSSHSWHLIIDCWLINCCALFHLVNIWQIKSWFSKSWTFNIWQTKFWIS